MFTFLEKTHAQLCLLWLLAIGWIFGGTTLLAQNIAFESRLLSQSNHVNYGSALFCVEPQLLAIADKNAHAGDGEVRLYDSSTSSYSAVYQSPLSPSSGSPLAFGSALLAFNIDANIGKEIFIGSPGEGSVYVFPTPSSASPIVFHGSPLEEFGSALAYLGTQSFSGSSFPVLAVGAPARGPGAVDVFRADLPFPSAIFSIVAPSVGFTNSRFGEILASVPDMDGDGIVDLAVSAPAKKNGGGSITGAVTLVRGALTGGGTPLIDLIGPLPGHAFGKSVLGIPDIDGDGLGELVVGAPAISSGHSGYIEVFSGSDLLSSPVQPLCRFMPLEIDDPSYGTALAYLGDSDGNGKVEVLVSSPHYVQGEYPGFSRGRVSAIEIDAFGCRAAGQIPIPFEYIGTNAQFGKALSQGNCDFQADGLPDVALSTMDELGDGQGSVLLYRGTGVSTVPGSSQFRFRIGGRGNLRGTNRFDIAPAAASDCHITLYAKMSIGDELRPLQEIASTPIAGHEFLFHAASLPKVSKVKGIRPVVHMATQTSCADASVGSLRSNIASRYMSCGIGDFGVSVAEWMRMFRESFSLDVDRRLRNEKRKKRALRKYKKQRRDFLSR